MAARASITRATKLKAERSERAAVRDAKRIERQETAKTAKAHDSYQNLALNLGVGGGNALYAGSAYGFNPISRYRVMLEWMYRGQWICGAACDHPAEDMTKAGIEMSGLNDPSHGEQLSRGLSETNVWGELADGIRYAKLYGGTVCVMLIDGQKLDTPLRIETVGRDDFKGLVTFDRWMLEPSLNDLVSDFGPHFGKPRFYTITDDAHVLRRQVIHYSRVVRFEGNKLPYQQRISEQLWGASVLERLYDRLVPFDSATAGTAQMLHKQHIRTYKIANLRQILATGGPLEMALMKMLNMMKTMQANEGLTVIDAADDFTMGAVNATAGMADAIIQFGQQISGALEEPMVRLFGMSPAGLNATGESDLRTHYDNVEKRQESTLRMPLMTILHVLARSKGIKLDVDKFNFKFISLNKMTEPDRAAVAEADTRSVCQVEQFGLIDAATALDEIRRRGQITGRWGSITDEMIEKARLDGPPSIPMEPGAGASEKAENALLGSEGGEGSGTKGTGAGGARMPGVTVN